MHFQGSQSSEVGFVGLFLLPPELFLLGLELVVLEVILARQVAGRIRLHLVVVPGEGAENHRSGISCRASPWSALR